MARKKSISGRSRGLTIESRLIRSVEKTNKLLNRLDAARLYNRYASRRILKLANAPAFKYNRKSKFKFKIRDVRSLNKQEQLFYLKNFEKFLKAKTSTVSGVKYAKEDMKEKVRKGLSEIAGKKLTDDDVEDFYDLQYNDDYKYFLQYIPPSDLYALILEAKEKSWNENQFLAGLEQLMTINIEETRIRAIRLYNKFVK